MLLSCSTNNAEQGFSPSDQLTYGFYIEASRNETFAICPPDKKAEGTWISEHSVSLNAENCVSIKTPDLAGTINVLFLENSGRTDTIQVLVDQSYIQMGDYSHKIWVFDPEASEVPANVHYSILMRYGRYENRSYNQNLIVDKTMFTMADAWRYSKIDNNIRVPHTHWQLESEYKGVKFEESKLPYVVWNVSPPIAWEFANLRSKMEGLDTAYHIFYKHSYSNKDMKKFIFLMEIAIGDTNMYNGFFALDTSASGYRAPLDDEWLFLMRAGASTRYYWGDEEDAPTVSRYAWMRPNELKPVAQLIPNRFGLYDMMGLAIETKFSSLFRGYVIPENMFLLQNTNASNYESFRLLRKTPKLQKLEKF
jgi:hypothetical protein